MGIPFMIMAADVFIQFLPIKIFFPHIISIAVYHLLAWNILTKNSEYQFNHFSSVHSLQIKWLRQFIISSFFICLTIEIAIFLMYLYNPVFQDAKWGFVILTVFVYWISSVAINQPEIFTVSNRIIEPLKENFLPLKKFKKYEKSNLIESERDRIIDTLQHIIQTKKPHLDSEINVDSLSKLLQCSRHHLSQVLNEHYQQSFYDFINGLRVAEAKRLLLDNEYHQPLKIAAISIDSGFNSLSSFNEVFKKSTGKTPSQFRKQNFGSMRQTG